VKDRLYYFQTTTDKVMQTHLCEPSRIHPQAKLFEKYYIQHSFEPTMKHFGFIGWRFKVNEIKKKIRKFVRRIKKIIA
jgi:hypothetical protein